MSAAGGVLTAFEGWNVYVGWGEPLNALMLAAVGLVAGGAWLARRRGTACGRPLTLGLVLLAVVVTAMWAAAMGYVLGAVREPRLANIALRAAIAPVAGWAAVVVRGRYGWVDWPLLLAVGAMMLLHLFVNAAANQLG